MKIRATILSAAILTLTATNLLGQTPTPGVFEIRYDTEDLTDDQRTTLQPVLDDAAAFWQSLITGYQPGVNLDGIDIDVSAIMIDQNGGADGNILAQAGPGPGFNFSEAGFQFVSDSDGSSSVGTLQFDEDDLDTPLLADVTKHEIGHTLGFGTLFTDNTLVDGDGVYSGAEGLAAYQTEVDPTATFVPLDPDNAHFLEASTEQDNFGRDFSDELLTSFVNSTPNSEDPFSNFVSATQLGVYRDLGYQTVLTVAIPEPSSVTLLCLGTVGLLGRRRKLIC